ncbi:MAG: Dihydroorotase [Myxococcota bacterium]|nr:Dihydroorotase [Myxococcota bacterium]
MLLIENAHVVDPAGQLDGVRSIEVDRGRIRRVLKSPPPAQERAEYGEIINASGMHLFPGFLDLRTFAGEPGYEYKESFATVSRAAAAGGFTGVAVVPWVRPVTDSAPMVRDVLKLAAAHSVVEVYPIAGATLGLKGETMTEAADLRSAGAVALSDGGRPVQNTLLLRRILEYAKTWGLTVFLTPRDPDLSRGALVSEGEVSARLGMRGDPAASEEIAVARYIALAELTGARVHIEPISTAGAIRQLRQALKRELPVTAAVTAHHAVLSERDAEDFDTNARLNPPLRSPKDRDAMQKALSDGTIAAVVSDHSPQSSVEKQVSFEEAEPGSAGLETVFGAVMDLVHHKVIDLPAAAGLLCTGPARVLGIKPNMIAEGEKANLCLARINADWTVRAQDFASKGRNSVFEGRPMKGKILLTLCNGKVVWHGDS